MLIINPKELEFVINQIPGVVTCGLLSALRIFCCWRRRTIFLNLQGTLKNVDRDYSKVALKVIKIVSTVGVACCSKGKIGA